MLKIKSTTPLTLGLLLMCTAHVFAQNTNENGEEVVGERPQETAVIAGKPIEERQTFGRKQLPAFAGQTRIGAVVTIMKSLI